MRRTRIAVAVAGALCWCLIARAHLCDDVWRQMDKLILKPDVTNLVAKPGEKTEFSVLMQHNMDRPIACFVKLIGESPGFDVTVEPAAGFNPVRPGQQYTYKVALAAKPDKPSGNYPVSFRLMGNDMRRQPRELKSLTLGGGAAAPAAGTATPAPPKKRAAVLGLGPDKTAPAVDGDVTDAAWRGPTPLSGFLVDEKTRARRETLIVPRCDPDRLWLMITCPGAPAPNDAVIIWLANPEKKNQRVSIRVESDGRVHVDHYRDEASRSVEPTAFGIKAAVAAGERAWYAEVEVPAPVVGRERIEKDQIWLVNFARDSKAPPAELSYWSGSPAAGQKVESFGELRLTP